MPAGTGKSIKICVFADKESEEGVMAAGADLFGTDDILKQMAEGNIPFDKLICTPE